MKKIKIEKRLALNKEVISRLNDKQMHDAKGGAADVPKHNTLSLGKKCTQEFHGCESGEISWGLFCRER